MKTKIKPAPKVNNKGYFNLLKKSLNILATDITSLSSLGTQAL